MSSAAASTRVVSNAGVSHERLDATAHLDVMSSGVFNCSGTLVTSVVGFLLVPFVVWKLGIAAYGMWVAASAVAAWFGTIDLGLPWTVPRTVAAANTVDEREEAGQFVNAAAWVSVGLGAVGALALIAIAWVGASALHVFNAEQLATTRVLLLLCAGNVLANQLSRLGTSVLEGCRRFDVANAVTAVQVITRATLVVAALLLGYGVVAYAAVHAVTEAILATALLIISGWMYPWLRLRPAWPRWASFRRQAEFGIVSQLNSLLVRTIYHPGVVILAAVAGPAATVPLSIGQKFPQATSILTDRAGAVFLPVSSAHERSANTLRSDVLAKGTRWVTALGLPIWIVLMALGPTIVGSWLRQVPSETVPVLWLCATSAFGDAVGSCAVHFVWGQEIVKRLTRVLLTTAALTLALTIAWAPRWHAAGVSAALMVSVWTGTLLTLRVAARSCGTSVAHILAPLRALLFPGAACAAVGLAAVAFGVHGWAGSAVAIAACGLAYIGGLFATPQCAAEADLVRHVWRSFRQLLVGEEAAP